MDHLWRAEKEQDQEYSPAVHRSEYQAVQIVYRQHIPFDTFRCGNFGTIWKNGDNNG